MKTKKLQRLRKEIDELKIKLDEAKREIKNKDGHINLLLESERELERIHKSRSWKILTKWWKIRDTLIPPDSKRRLLLKLAAKFLSHPIWFLKHIDVEHIKKFYDGFKNRNIASTVIRIDKYLGGNNENFEYPDLLPINSFKKLADVPVLNLPTSNNPIVSIIIPVYNNFACTYTCLKSIAKNSGDVPYEIIVADDNSTDLTQKIKKIIMGINVIRNKKRLGFLLNCNQAARHAKGKYILFLNNDTQVMKNWLNPLLNLIETGNDIGIVGSKLLYPDGHLQEAGGIVWQDGTAWNFGHMDNPEKPEYNYVKEVDYISGASMVIKRELWNSLKGFDDNFAPAYYEDTDLAFRVRHAGYKVMFQPLSIVIHYEGISNGTNIKNSIKAFQAKNLKKFVSKWDRILKNEHEINGLNVFKARDRSQRKKHILVVDHYVPHYDHDAGGRCTYMYLKLFVKMGFQVTFIGDNFFRHEPYTSVLNQMGIEVLYGNYYCRNWRNWLKNNGKYFDYIYLQRPHISIKYINVARQCSNAKIIYFAHDLHYLRERRAYELTGNAQMLKLSEELKKKEYMLFAKADVVHVVGSYEQNILQKAFPDKPIRNIPIYLYERLPVKIEKDFSKRRDLLYVGGFNHQPNIDAVFWFVEKIFPIILKKYPNIIWHIVGGGLTKEIKALACSNIIIHGYISDAKLEELYRNCRIAVVPLRYGAGVKGKIIEASYYQIPIVTTPIGAEGISLDENSMIVEQDASKIGNIICALYEDMQKLKLLSDRSEILIRNHYMIEEAEKIINLDFNY